MKLRERAEEREDRTRRESERLQSMFEKKERSFEQSEREFSKLFFCLTIENRTILYCLWPNFY